MCVYYPLFESSLEIDRSSLEVLSPKRSRLTALVAAARSLFGRESLRSALQSKQEPHIPWYRSPSVALLPVSVLVLFQVCCWAIPSGDASDFGAPSYCTVRDSKLPFGNELSSRLGTSLYNGETAPKALRGTLLVLYQLQIIIGRVSAYISKAQTGCLRSTAGFS